MIAPPVPELQGLSQRSRRGRQRVWSTRCRALAATLLLGASLGCGAVSFVPSPFTPQKVDLIYSAQEDITVVRWRISSTESTGSDLEFQILGDAGYQTIDFSQSVFPGGPTACGDGDGTCFQYVVRGEYPVGDRPHPIRAIHALYGVLPGTPAALETPDQTLGVVSFFHTTNDAVYVNITDAVASGGPFVYPRTYERTMWPTNGLCLSALPPDSVSFLPLDKTGGFPPDLPLTDTGTYCVGVRPVPNDAGAAALAETRVETLPEVVNVNQTFTPPIQVSPVIYQIILDLEIPLADRCASAIQQIESLVDTNMGMAGAPVVPLPVVNIATGTDPTGAPSDCTQSDTRVLPVDAIVQTILQAVTSNQQTLQAVQVLYFNNANAPLPTALSTSLSQLASDLYVFPTPYRVDMIYWLFNPGLAAASNSNFWTISDSWQASDDPSFAQALATYVQQNLPYTSQTYDPLVPQPLLSATQVSQYAGGLFKICSSAPPITPASTVTGQALPGGPSWPITTADPPAFQAPTLPQQYFIPAPAFVPASTSISTQVCTRYCDNHPFVSTANAGVDSWSESPACEASP